MQNWIAPFIYVAVVLTIYLFAPIEKRTAVQGRIRENLNALIITALVLIVLGIISTLNPRQGFLKWTTRGALVGAVIYAGAVSFREKPPLDSAPQ